MASAGGEHSWLDLQRRRDERLRLEVLRLLHQAAGGDPQNTRSFALQLGIWDAELFRGVEWLAHPGFVRCCGPGPSLCITVEGVRYLEQERYRRRTIRAAPH